MVYGGVRRGEEGSIVNVLLLAHTHTHTSLCSTCTPSLTLPLPMCLARWCIESSEREFLSVGRRKRGREREGRERWGEGEGVTSGTS